MAGLDGFVHEVNACDCVNCFGKGFGPPQKPLEELMYLLVHVNHVSPCQLLVPGKHGKNDEIQEWGLEELLAGLEGGDHKVESCYCTDPVGGVFVPPP